MIRRMPSSQVDEQLRNTLTHLWDAAFGDRFTIEDAEHAFGGTHVLVHDDDLLVAHASVVPRTLLVGERPLAVGYVEAVAVLPDRQRHGYGSRAMAEIADVIRTSYELGALSTASRDFYARLGWKRWQGPSFVIRDGERLRTPDDDGYLMVLPFGATADLDLSVPICCDDRPGDVW